MWQAIYLATIAYSTTKMRDNANWMKGQHKVHRMEMKTAIFFFPAEDGIRDRNVTGVKTCALPIYGYRSRPGVRAVMGLFRRSTRRLPLDRTGHPQARMAAGPSRRFGLWGPFPSYAHRSRRGAEDRKSTRLNSSHVSISYAVFCLKK